MNNADLIKAAAQVAAITIDAPEPAELAHVTPTFVAALTGLTGGVAAEDHLKVPGWDPSPGRTDVTIRTGDVIDAAIEVKAYKLHWCLWDALKVASLVAGGTAAEGYVPAAASTTRFAKPADFAEVMSGSRELETRTLIRDYRVAWAELLDGGAARPMLIPARLRTDVVCARPFTYSPSWEVRVVRVRPIGTEQVVFEDGWPV
jgi:hypothetical protein